MSTPNKSQYSYLALHEAYREVREKGYAIRKAARLHGLPESTLRWRLANDKPIAKRGCPSFFTRAQEEMLAEHCVAMAHLGYGFTRWQILDMAKNVSSALGCESEPTKHWFYGFLQRFPDLKMVNPKKREKARDDSVNEDMLQDYFKELENTLDKYEIKNRPQNLWNVDETGISLDHNPPKILAKAGTNPHCVTSGKSATTTVIAAGSALGETIPPYVIFKGERLSKNLKDGGVTGTEYRSSQSGWSNSQLFLDFFSNHFVHHVSVRPCLLLYDGHSTHITYEVIEKARKENIHLFVLPPHSSHCLQPLDVSVFSPFKKSLSSECHKFLHAHPNCVITREDLPLIIGTAFQSSLTVSTIMSGFRKTGIFPFNPAAPTVPTPTVDRKIQESKTTRKERKDGRTVKILFQEKFEGFNKLKESVEPKPKRKTFVPPYGAAITEDIYFEKKKTMADEKKNMAGEKKEKKEKNQNENKKQLLCKRKLSFTPPFSQKDTCETQDQEQSNSEVTTKKQKKSEKVSERKENNGKQQKKKGKGALPNSVRGKGLVKRKNGPSTEMLPQSHSQSDIVEDTECCVVCGKFQPTALDLDKSLKFVDWGCCSSCGKWVHLKFCTDIEKLDVSEEFRCPMCVNEQ